MAMDKNELLGFMYNDAVSAPRYFMWGTAWLEDGVLHVEDLEEQFEKAITLTDFEEAANYFARFVKDTFEERGLYWQNFAKAWLSGDFDAVDYDATVLDAVLQLAMNGELLYA